VANLSGRFLRFCEGETRIRSCGRLRSLPDGSDEATGSSAGARFTHVPSRSSFMLLALESPRRSRGTEGVEVPDWIWQAFERPRVRPR